MEVWKDIEGFEGIYQISNLGRVKSYPLIRIDKNGVQKLYNGKFLKGHVNSIGYNCFDLWKNSVRKNIKAHFLVAYHFVDGYNQGLWVNHKNGIKTDNRPENLEWVTAKENSIHAFKNRLIVRKGFDVLHLKTGIFFESIKDAYNSGLVKGCFSSFKNKVRGVKKNDTDFVKI